MCDQYTPTTLQVKYSYIAWIKRTQEESGIEFDRSVAEAEFDSWLAERDRQVAAKALEDLAWDGFEAYLVDPELEWENQPSVAAQHFKSSAEKLRRRADEYRKESSNE